MLFADRQFNNNHYLPTTLDLPADLEFAPKVFGWGLFGPSSQPGLAALDTQNQTFQIAVPTFIWGLTGVSNDNTGPGNSNSGFLFSIFHTHNGNQYQFFNRAVFSGDILGSGPKPFYLRKPHLLLPGDSIEVQVQNLGSPAAPAVTSIQVVLLAGDSAGTLGGGK